MSPLKFIIVGLSAAFLSTAAVAFQEQQQRSITVAPDAPKAGELAPETSSSAKPSGGTEVRIPGLGKLGSLPKMDFGLELLYGATEPKQPEAQGRDDVRDDLTVRGTVKHKF